MKHIKSLMVIALCLFFVGQAYGTLTTIGTASYDSDGNGSTEDYKLIYDNDSPFGSIIWLDYTKDPYHWDYQQSWITSLNTGGVLTYNLNSGVAITSTGDWRLPLTVDGEKVNYPDSRFYNGTGPNGFNITTSELGHLFYSELGNVGDIDTSGTITSCSALGTHCLTNTGVFDSLDSHFYWSDTEYSVNSDEAWGLNFYYGWQDSMDKGYYRAAIAVQTAEVSFNQVPEPSTILLLGAGLAGFGLLRRRLKK